MDRTDGAAVLAVYPGIFSAPGFSRWLARFLHCCTQFVFDTDTVRFGARSRRERQPLMNTAPRLALIINTYNQPDYLSRVLGSLSYQTSAPDEVLLADDGSGDDTRQIFITWAKSLPM